MPFKDSFERNVNSRMRDDLQEGRAPRDYTDNDHGRKKGFQTPQPQEEDAEIYEKTDRPPRFSTIFGGLPDRTPVDVPPRPRRRSGVHMPMPLFILFVVIIFFESTILFAYTILGLYNNAPTRMFGFSGPGACGSVVDKKPTVNFAPNFVIPQAAPAPVGGQNIGEMPDTLHSVFITITVSSTSSTTSTTTSGSTSSSTSSSTSTTTTSTTSSSPIATSSAAAEILSDLLGAMSTPTRSVVSEVTVITKNPPRPTVTRTTVIDAPLSTAATVHAAPAAALSSPDGAPAIPSSTSSGKPTIPTTLQTSITAVPSPSSTDLSTTATSTSTTSGIDEGLSGGTGGFSPLRLIPGSNA